MPISSTGLSYSCQTSSKGSGRLFWNATETSAIPRSGKVAGYPPPSYGVVTNAKLSNTFINIH